MTRDTENVLYSVEGTREVVQDIESSKRENKVKVTKDLESSIHKERINEKSIRIQRLVKWTRKHTRGNAKEERR